MSESNIRLLPGITLPDKPIELQPDKDTVEKLEKALRWAQEGRLRSVGLAMVFDDGRTSQMFSMYGRRHALAASISYLQHRHCTFVIDDSDPETELDGPTDPAA